MTAKRRGYGIRIVGCEERESEEERFGAVQVMRIHCSTLLRGPSSVLMKLVLQLLRLRVGRSGLESCLPLFKSNAIVVSYPFSA